MIDSDAIRVALFCSAQMAYFGAIGNYPCPRLFPVSFNLEKLLGLTTRKIDSLVIQLLPRASHGMH